MSWGMTEKKVVGEERFYYEVAGPKTTILKIIVLCVLRTETISNCKSLLRWMSFIPCTEENSNEINT